MLYIKVQIKEGDVRLYLIPATKSSFQVGVVGPTLNPPPAWDRHESVERSPPGSARHSI